MSNKLKIFFTQEQAMGYPSDLTDAEWEQIEHHFQPNDRRGSSCLHLIRIAMLKKTLANCL